MIEPVTESIVGCGNHLPEGVDRRQAPPPPTGSVAQWPIKTDGTEACWQTSAPTFRQYLEEGRIKLGRLNATTGRYGLSFLPKGAMRAIAEGESVVEGRDEKGSLLVSNADGRIRSQVGKTIWTNVSIALPNMVRRSFATSSQADDFPFQKACMLLRTLYATTWVISARLLSSTSSQAPEQPLTPSCV